MSDRTAYDLLKQLADIAKAEGEDQELVDALEAGALALAAFVRINHALDAA